MVSKSLGIGRLGLGVWILLSVFALSACASPWTAQVTTYQQWPATQARYFIPIPADHSHPLEYQTVADTVRIAMGAVGLVEGDSTSRWQVYLNYHSPMHQEWIQRYVDPGLMYGGGPFAPFGMWGGLGGGYGGVFYTGPQWVTVPIQIYDHTLEVVIKDKQHDLKEIYRVTAVHRSQNNDLIQSMPNLAKAAFAGFPEANASLNYVEIY